MLFKAAAFVALVASASAESLRPGTSLSASSTAGQRLLSKARALNDAERDVTWVANYDIKYTGCSSLIQVREEAGGDEGLLYTQNLVKFSLCPSSGSCSTCLNGAEYVVSMMEFVDAYTEFKMNEQEQICENIRENCYCDNANDDEVCENQCYVNAGQESCIEYEGDVEFEIQEYLECKEMEENNNNNNGNYNYNNNGGDNWYGQYFIGPYCSESDGFSIHLGVFYDEGCSARADASAYSNRNYGAELPFASESIVSSSCISCEDVDEDNNNNNNNGNYNYELAVNELCDAVYEQSAKCESGLENVQYADTTGCEYIQQLLPKLDTAARSYSSKSSNGHPAATAFAWIFGFTTVLFAVYAVFLYKKLTRASISLN